jgi:multisubunit Na+/H+ antiporter MnhF subunit
MEVHSDRRNLRIRRAYDAVLTGIPFGIFKFGTGWLLGGESPVLGAVVAVWGALDIILNLLAVVFPVHFSWCVLSNLGRHLGPRWEDRLLALDTFIAFAIVSTMIGFRLLSGLPSVLGRVWDVAVICNVMGVGVDRLYRSWSR